MPDIVLSILGVGILLFIVGLLPALAARLRLPLTVLLAGFGCVLGVLIHAGRDMDVAGAGDFVGALRSFNLSSAAFLYVFLPTLLFDMGLALDVRRLFDDIVPILILAVVAVVVCTLVVGAALSWASGLTLVACLLLGSIVATTDPAAVVTIFRDLGAPRRLSILVEGESLLNDAAAISLYSLLVAILVEGRDAGAAATALAFVRSFAGGAAVGWACATAACAIVLRLRGIRVAEITLTVALAYLAFVVSERYFGVSGVVAVVVAALVVGSKGRTRVSPATWDGLVDTWQQLGFWANSLIFVLAAMRAPAMLADAGWGDLLLLLALVGATLGARALILFGLLPGLAKLRLAKGVSAPYATVILWGGLRGAVSLALALAVFEHPSLPEEVRRFVGILVTSYVLYTLFVNGLTLRPLIKLLGLDKLSPADRAVRDRALELALQEIGAKIAEVAATEGIDEKTAAAVLKEVGARAEGATTVDSGLECSLTTEDRVTIGLRTLASRERELALERYRGGLLSRPAVDAILGRCGRLADGAKTSGADGYEAAAAKSLEFSATDRLALSVHRRFGVAALLASRLEVRFETLLAEQGMLRDLQEFARRQLRPLLGRDSSEYLDAILHSRSESAKTAIAALELQFPEYARTLQGNLLERAALRLEDDAYREMLAESVIPLEVYNDLARRLESRRAEVGKRPRLDVALRREDLVAGVPMFSAIGSERLARIAAALKPRFALPGEKIIERGGRGDSMYFIASGAVEVQVPPKPVQLGTGEFFGELALLTEKPRIADVVALSYCRLLVLQAKDFSSLLSTDESLKSRIDEVAKKRLGESAPK